tara:strand:- start:75 stop:320 length:246 start_codon:yes stop_codon:yes gene_type:complete
MAFEQVYILNNTSVIADEVLAHRIGLLPIQVDPRMFQFQTPGEDPSDTVRTDTGRYRYKYRNRGRDIDIDLDMQILFWRGS